MGRSSGTDRTAQVEPTAALVAVFAVALGLSVYAGVLQGVIPEPGERAVAREAVDRVEEAASTTGVVDPRRLDRGLAVAPDGYHLNATLVVGDRRWHAGPTPPATIRYPPDGPAGDAKARRGTGANVATRRVSARLDSGAIRPGRLAVVIWR